MANYVGQGTMVRQYAPGFGDKTSLAINAEGAPEDDGRGLS